MQFLEKMIETIDASKFGIPIKSHVQNQVGTGYNSIIITNFIQ